LELLDKVEVFLREGRSATDGIVGNLLEAGLWQLQHLLVDRLDVLVLLLLCLLLNKVYCYSTKSRVNIKIDNV
jgi:hypothetical protein